ncbi:MAG: FAD-dependent oxidoreductase [Chloroflexi bacterium]|nr:FAD-dependent oxidoreductase [Chloroflexota bacterium]
MEEKFDAIVVGAGPAGTTAAYLLAKAGLNIILLERGDYPGTKNVFGGVLYSSVLNRLIPNFWEEAPVERHVSARQWYLLSPTDALSFGFQSQEFDSPPFNNSFTVLRSQFDRWYAAKAEEAGAFLITSTVVDDLLIEGERVVGVRARRDEGELYADVVIAADGVNSLLAQKAGFREELKPEAVALGIKEVIALPTAVLEERFHISGDRGLAMEFFGEGATKGLEGSAFLYTNKDSLSLGVTVVLKSLFEKKEKSVELVEHFKSHPVVKELIKGGELREYQAHLIPYGNRTLLTGLCRDGLLVVGDAAGLVNPTLYYEGTNMAMASGAMAAEAILAAREEGDFSQRSLSRYQQRLEQSFVGQDLTQYRGLGRLMEERPQLYTSYATLLCRLAAEFLAVREEPRGMRERAMAGRVQKEMPDLWEAWQTVRRWYET